jgi:hypothetical protein
MTFYLSYVSHSPVKLSFHGSTSSFTVPTHPPLSDHRRPNHNKIRAFPSSISSIPQRAQPSLPHTFRMSSPSGYQCRSAGTGQGCEKRRGVPRDGCPDPHLVITRQTMNALQSQNRTERARSRNIGSIASRRLSTWKLVSWSPTMASCLNVDY